MVSSTVPWNSKNQSKSIATKELLPIILAGIVWGRKWRGLHVKSYCDNQAVVAVMQSRYSRDNELMHLLCSLFFIEAMYGFQITAVHVPGSHNILADDLSHNRLPSFLSKAPTAMDPEPTPIPEGIMDLLGSAQGDWSSESWTSAFSSFLVRS